MELKLLPNNMTKWVFLLLAIVVAGYSLSYYWHSDNPFNTRYHSLNRVALYSHFFGGGIALLIGAIQLVQARGSRRHRLLGWLYCGAVALAALGGFYLAFHSFLGWATGGSFVILDLLWLGATALAVVRVRNGDIAAHRRWMLRSVALSAAAISLRILLGLFCLFFAFQASYLSAAWLCWMLNLALVETYLYFNHTSTFTGNDQENLLL